MMKRMHFKRVPLFFLLFSSLVFPLHLPDPSVVQAEEVVIVEEPATPLDALTQELKDGFRYILKVDGLWTKTGLADSSLNPNNVLNLPGQVYDLEARPDFNLDFRRLSLMVKPRFREEWRHWEEGDESGHDESFDEWYINEWLAQVRLVGDLYASYGRENLQWGPSYLLSPSNPFFRDNGRANPKREVAGMEFARLVWIPASSWTVSLIADTDEGRQNIDEEAFNPCYAVKLDYTTFKKYISLIGSKEEGEDMHLGSFAGWTVSDALLVYAEGTLAQGSPVLYPEVTTSWPDIVTDIGSPQTVGPIRMVASREDDNSLEGILLLGASYTLEIGPTFIAEFVYNSAGYDEEEAELIYIRREQFAYFYYYPSDYIHSLAEKGLAKTPDSNQRLFRQHYLMFQYQQTQIFNMLSLVLRFTYNLDDHSSQVIPIMEYDMSDHSQLFLVGAKTFGDDNTEYGSILDYNVMVGVEYTF